MGSNQASIARRQRERERKQKQAEKAAQKAERREQKGKSPSGGGDSPMDDPTIDWSFAVRETKIEEPEPAEDAEVEGEAP